MEAHYEPPTIEWLGSLADLTRGGATGAALDASFPVGTPFTDLTFS